MGLSRCYQIGKVVDIKWNYYRRRMIAEMDRSGNCVRKLSMHQTLYSGVIGSQRDLT